MELASENLEQLAFITRPKNEEHMFFAMDKSTHEEHLSQPLQTNNKQVRKTSAFLSGYIGITVVTSKNNKFKFYFAKSITDKDGFIQIVNPQGAYEVESLYDEIKRIIIEEGYFMEVDYPFTIKPNISTLGSFKESSRQEPLISFLHKDCKRDLL